MATASANRSAWISSLPWIEARGEEPKLLAIQHVPWEAPHRILGACDGLEVVTAHPSAGDPLPRHDEVAGAVVMGGPMNVDDVDAFPALAHEREWIAAAIAAGMPVLGVCLGAQLIARALGAEVRAGAPEIGFSPVEVEVSGDPIVGPLAPATTVLHWHGDVLDLPDGATPLATSARTEHQAFRYENAWALLFHAEADAALLDGWLAIPEMAVEATRALGPEAPAILRRQALEAEGELIRRSTPAFEAFADLVAAHRPG